MKNFYRNFPVYVSESNISRKCLKKIKRRSSAKLPVPSAYDETPRYEFTVSVFRPPRKRGVGRDAARIRGRVSHTHTHQGRTVL